MEIVYSNTLEDHLEFGRYHRAHSPTLKRRMLWHRWGFPAAYVFLGLVMSVLDAAVGKPPVAAVVFGIVAIIWALFYPRWAEKSTDRLVRRLFREGENRGLGQEQRLTLTIMGISFSSNRGDGSTTWDAVERLVASPDYLYLYLSATSALMIPRRAFHEPGEFEAFVDEARRLREEAAGLITA